MAILLTALLLATLGASTTQAGLVVSLPDVVISGDGINPVFGEFEVLLTLTGNDLTTPPSISSYNLDFSVAGAVITLNAPTPTTTAPPLFSGGSFASLTTGQIVKAAADLFSSTPTSAPAFQGVGLVKVGFAAQPGQLGIYALDFGSLNQITGPDALSLPVTFDGGSISIVAAVPEAGAGMLASAVALSAVICAGVRRRRLKAIVRPARTVPVVVGCALVAATGPLASAAIRFELPQVKAFTDGATAITGAFDVVVRADAGDLPRQVGAFNVDLHTTSANVTFGPPQASPAPLLPGAPTNYSPNSQTIRAARDVFPDSYGLTDAAQLIRVPYTIPAGALGSFPLAFGQFNQLASAQAQSLAIVTTDLGSIGVFYLADFTEDGKVNTADLAAFTAGFGSVVAAGHSQGDANSDSNVDGSDLLVWQRQLGRSASASPSTLYIPEPASIVLCLSALMWMSLQH